MLSKIKEWIKTRLNAWLLIEIGKLDLYAPTLAAVIRQQTDPEMRADQIILFAQDQLQKGLDKIFSKISLNSFVFSLVKKELQEEIASLPKYRSKLIKLIDKNVNPDKLAQILIDQVQDTLVGLVTKYLTSK